MRTIVNGVLVRPGNVLLAKRSSHRKAYPSVWSFPGGHVEGNETLLEALARELVEEIGITPTKIAPLGSIADPNSTTTDPIEYHMFTVADWDGGDPGPIGDEHTELVWFALQDACSLPDLALEEYVTLIRNLDCA